jgi:hypothetical protein
MNQLTRAPEGAYRGHVLRPALCHINVWVVRLAPWLHDTFTVLHDIPTVRHLHTCTSGDANLQWHPHDPRKLAVQMQAHHSFKQQAEYDRGG